MPPSGAAPSPETRPSAPQPASADAPIADGVEYALDPRYLALEKRRGWIRAIAYPLLWLAIVSAALALWAFRDFVIAPVYAAWGLLALGYATWCVRRPVIAYRHSSYRIDQHGIEIRDGVFWRRVVSVPRSRVQHIDVSQGPFERRAGIGTLSIHTAGVSNSVVTLPGLDHARALRIRDFLLPERGDTGV